MKVVYFLAALALTASLPACGHKDDQAVVTANSTTTPDTSSFIGGRCGEQVTRDYFQLNLLCRFPRDRMEAHRCRESAEDFLRHYPAVSCSVAARDGRFGEVRDRRIEAREIQDILERLRRSGF